MYSNCSETSFSMELIAQLQCRGCFLYSLILKSRTWNAAARTAACHLNLLLKMSPSCEVVIGYFAHTPFAWASLIVRYALASDCLDSFRLNPERRTIEVGPCSRCRLSGSTRAGCNTPQPSKGALDAACWWLQDSVASHLEPLDAPTCH